MTKVNKPKKEIEYPDAPSGYVTMYNYKEPFMPFSEGYGYQGVLIFDGATDKVQCHLCGQWFHALGNHLHKEHAMRASEYKEVVGLSPRTALIGEQMRQKLIANGQERFKNLRVHRKHTQATKDKIRATLQSGRREYQNITGTCPAQLVYRLQKKAEELGRCPTRREITFCTTLERVYGSFGEACRMSGLTPLKPGQTLRMGKTAYTVEYFVNLLRPFWIRNKRFPRAVDFTKKLGLKRGVWEKYSKIHKEVQQKILYGEKSFTGNSVKIRHTKEELLNELRNFISAQSRPPSVSDCRRGLLPCASVYYYHFGSLKEALKQV